MKINKKLMTAFVFFLSTSPLFAAQSTDDKNIWTIGTMVTYSELCGFYQGEGLSNLKLRNIVDHYANNRAFMKGYERDRNMFAHDGVSGLDNCSKINAALDKFERTLKTSE